MQNKCSPTLEQVPLQPQGSRGAGTSGLLQPWPASRQLEALSVEKWKGRRAPMPDLSPRNRQTKLHQGPRHPRPAESHELMTAGEGGSGFCGGGIGSAAAGEGSPMRRWLEFQLLTQ
jgi:hypothetical protein